MGSVVYDADTTCTSYNLIVDLSWTLYIRKTRIWVALLSFIFIFFNTLDWLEPDFYDPVTRVCMVVTCLGTSGGDWLSDSVSCQCCCSCFILVSWASQEKPCWLGAWLVCDVCDIYFDCFRHQNVFLLHTGARRGGACDVQWMCVCIALGFFGLVDLC